MDQARVSAAILGNSYLSEMLQHRPPWDIFRAPDAAAVLNRTSFCAATVGQKNRYVVKQRDLQHVLYHDGGTLDITELIMQLMSHLWWVVQVKCAGHRTLNVP